MTQHLLDLRQKWNEYKAKDSMEGAIASSEDAIPYRFFEPSRVTARNLSASYWL